MAPLSAKRKTAKFRFYATSEIINTAIATEEYNNRNQRNDIWKCLVDQSTWKVERTALGKVKGSNRATNCTIPCR